MSKEMNGSWKVHTPNMLKEVLVNEQCHIFSVPFSIFGKLLGAVADRAVELDDKELNKLMLRLTLFSAADPDSDDFMGSDKLEEYLKSEEKK